MNSEPKHTLSETLEEAGEWLSLQEASTRMGVATSTLRRWGDEGRVPMKRTLGGHRRFDATAVERLTVGVAPAIQVLVASPPAPVQPWGVDESAMARQEWHTHFASQAGAERMRGLGQRLLGLLMQYINRRNDDTRFLDQAREVGAAYGKEARDASANLHDTVEAFLFFRGAFSRLALPVPAIAQPTDLDEAAALHQRIDHFMDTILLGLIDGYGHAS